MPRTIFDELSNHAPERLWLTGLSTSGSRIQLKGESLDNELVALLLHAMGESAYFDMVDLDSTELSSSKSGLKLVKFQLQAQMVSPKPDKKKKATAMDRDEPPAEPVAS